MTVPGAGGRRTPLELAEEFEQRSGNEGSVALHLAEYGAFLAHVYFMEEINPPLFQMLLYNEPADKIACWVQFIERMWFLGDDAAQNVVVVTIMEKMGDDDTVWENLKAYVSDAFRHAANRFGSENILGRTFDNPVY